MDIQRYIDRLLTLAIAEDIGDGDHTSRAVISPRATGAMKLLVKESGVIAGIGIATQLFKRIDSRLTVEQLLDDGVRVKPGDVAFYVSGRVRALLQAERIALNIMQRMSGVATQTATYVNALQGLKTQVLDTRKTTPGMRVLDKLAVKIGGGANHRMGLFDMILLKDNHVDFAGGIEPAILKAQEYLQRTGRRLAIEIEVRSLDDLRTVLRVGGVQRIMFDNFDLPATREAVALVAGRYETESSGGITLGNLRAYAACGVDFISVGALTHQIKSLDLSLKAV
jgi:nicotinate-nucleotide pyrophosphorylase (carboxylating)